MTPGPRADAPPDPGRSPGPVGGPGPRAVEWGRFDETVLRFAAHHPELQEDWLFLQTMMTAGRRRALLQVVAPPSGSRSLDVGTGFGPMALELAGLARVSAVGVDTDAAKVGLAAELAAALVAADWLEAGSVRFDVGDVYGLGFPDASFDLVTARYLFQHLTEPERAVAELRRVLRPGGTLCVIDVDDGMAITYPEFPAEFRAVTDALADDQARAGGDRHVGRKLPGLLTAAGMQVTSIVVMAEARYGSPTAEPGTRTYLVDRIEAARSSMVASGLRRDDDLDAAVAYVRDLVLPDHFVLGGDLAVAAANPD